jgi:hypothetical protein
MREVERAVGELEPISLEQLDEQAKLRRRVDSKYVVPDGVGADTVRSLASAYRALEIDSLRRFTYESVYFDTPDLRCFCDHVGGARPRYKIRSRYYRETDACFFEIKVKQSGDETIKRQRPYDHADHGTITPEARAFLDETLTELTGEESPGDLAPSLITSYQRLTLAAREAGERATLDLAVELRAMDGSHVELRDGVGLVETKTDESGGRLDEELRSAGCEPISISKYRLGIGLLLAEDPDSASVESLRSCFVAA